MEEIERKLLWTYFDWRLIFWWRWFSLLKFIQLFFIHFLFRIIYLINRWQLWLISYLIITFNFANNSIAIIWNNTADTISSIQINHPLKAISKRRVRKRMIQEVSFKECVFNSSCSWPSGSLLILLNNGIPFAQPTITITTALQLMIPTEKKVKQIFNYQQG